MVLLAWQFFFDTGARDVPKFGKSGIMELGIPALSGWMDLREAQIAELAVRNPAKIIQVPDVQGEMLAKAKNILSRKKLECKVVRVASRRAENTVILQDIKPGRECKPGSRLVLQVSKGMPPTPAPSVRPQRSGKPPQKPEKKNNNKYDGVIE